ncbi:hypothetical protein [Tumebacillus lipolyticus]|uniref:Uncharacterized protein n=1 Tax=Tumebacillus lipolyticus TaxID=1280370 RepID=A0ABW4ZZ58_9BACL
MTERSLKKRLEWLERKARSGKLTKQEQLELGASFLTSAFDQTKKT